MNEIGSKIKELRKKKGLSQEDLAESSKVNLRTIQRIENDESEPRGTTLHMICEVLDCSAEDILDYGKKTDKNFIVFFHLSVLTFSVIPLGNIIIPLILWLTKKDKIMGLKDIGSNLLNFQIFWTALFYLMVIIWASLLIIKDMASFTLLICSLGIMGLLNIILPISFAIKASNGNFKTRYPNIIRLIK